LRRRFKLLLIVLKVIKIRSLDIEMGQRFLGSGAKSFSDHILYFQIIIEQHMEVTSTGKRSLETSPGDLEPTNLK